MRELRVCDPAIGGHLFTLAQALADYKAALLESKRRMREGVDEFYSEQAGSQQPAQQGGGWKIEVVQ